MKAALSSRIIKGGALLDETRQLAEVWEPTLSPDENLRRIEQQNLLGKPSHLRTANLLDVLRTRLVEPGPQVMATLRTLRDRPVVFREASYYEAARADGLLAAFAEEPLWERYLARRTVVTIQDAVDWLAGLEKFGRLPPWKERVRVRTAQGLLSTLRDFGVLEGAVQKRIARSGLSPAGLAYVAYREQEQDTPIPVLLGGPVWRRWLLDRERVMELLAQGTSLGVLRYSQAGSVARIDWQITNLEELAHALG